MVSLAKRFILAWVVFWLADVAVAQSADRLAVTEADDGYGVSVPVSRLELLVPRGELVFKPLDIGGSTANPRYFHFESANGAVLSGWFEPSQRYRGAEVVWNGDSAAWRQRNLPVPADVNFERRGQWDAVFYHLPLPGGSSAHVRAHWVQSGTWIDVHLSVTGKEPYAINRKAVEALLQSLKVREKSTP